MKKNIDIYRIRKLFLVISFLCSALISLGDSMGNITSLTRNGRQDGGTYGKVNQLTYGYDGNHLVSVSDAVTSPTYNGFFGFNDGASQAVEYEYDANGNMTRDRNKGISSVQYNADNLPLRIQYDNGSRATYLYTADGTKLQVRYETSYAGLLSSGPPSGSASTAIAQTHTIDYVGNKIYEDGTLKKILVDGGYVEYNGGSPVYHAYLTDHQGNVRMVVDESATAKQVNHYYPYGGLIAESTGGDVQRYKYNGKELDRMHGLDWYDHGARHNDAAIGRWHSMDEKCEKYYDVSPYVYCEGNPVNAIDPDGREVVDRLYTKNTGEETTKQNYLHNIHDNDNAIILMAHGSITGTGIIIAENNVIRDEKIGMPYEMEKYLDDNSKTWEMGNISSIAPEIVLFSCGTGASGKFAQTISYDETFKDIKIYAPSDDINIHPNGTCSIDNGGYWCEYVNGELTNTYSDSFVPGTKEFSEASYWEKMNKIEIDWTKK